MNTQAMTRHDLEVKIVQRTWADEGFRGEFLVDPTGTVSRHFDIPADRVPWVIVHQETPDSWHIVLPAKPASTDVFSDTDLKKVA
jgi:hypothetical protein